MLKKIYAKLKSDGIGGFLAEIYYRALPRRLTFFPQLSHHFQSGTGLEIGGPSKGIFGSRGLMPIYPIAENIDNCNFDSGTIWEGKINEGDTFIFNRALPPGHQYLCEASDLHAIEDASYDYILSSHCVEHLANPLQGLAEWARVLKDDGIFVLVVPHKDGTFDHRRPVATLEHLREDFDNHTSEDDTTHLDEILELHDLGKDPGAGDYQSFVTRSKRNFENRCLHQHTFDTRLAIEAVNCTGLQILAVELFRPYHIVIVAKNTAQDRAPDNGKFRGLGTAPCWTSPFPSDNKNHPEAV